MTEGIYDALSVEEVGYRAIALMGVGYNRLLQFCKAFRHYTLILSLDNDERGTETIKKLSEELKNIGIKHIIRQSLKKDFNEDLINDRETFSDLLQSAVADAKKVESESEIRYRNETCLVNYFEEFEQVRLKNQNKSYIPTGFNSLDSLLDGGLFSGLYIIGAISLLGKSTLCLQMLDNIAKSGTDVLIFSLEMAKSELLAKSISRLTFTKSSNQRNIEVSGRTTRDVLTNKQSYDQVAKSISDAIDTYKNEYSKHVYILEGVGNYDVKEIRKGIETHINMTGNKPVVLIDYLQVIQPYDNKSLSDKQNTDKTVLELKRISREFDITVLVISSFNRENYYQSVSLTSFKESGSIEYSSDVLIGLQYAIDLNTIKETDKKKEELKNRIEKVRSDAKDGKPIEIQEYTDILFGKVTHKLIMSGSILKPDIFVEELGLGDYTYIEVPSIVPVKQRPIKRDYVGSMSMKNFSRNFPLLVSKIKEIADNHQVICAEGIVDDSIKDIYDTFYQYDTKTVVQEYHHRIGRLIHHTSNEAYEEAHRQYATLCLVEAIIDLPPRWLKDCFLNVANHILVKSGLQPERPRLQVAKTLCAF